MRQPAEGAGKIGPGFHPGIANAQFGIAPAARRAAFGRGQGAMGGKGQNVVAQTGDGLIIDRGKLANYVAAGNVSADGHRGNTIAMRSG